MAVSISILSLYLPSLPKIFPRSPMKFTGSHGNIQRSRTSLQFTHHYSDAIMGPIASQITSLAIVYSTVYPGADQRKHQNSASLAFVRWIHRLPVTSPHKWPVTRKMFPFDDVIMLHITHPLSVSSCIKMKVQSFSSHMILTIDWVRANWKIIWTLVRIILWMWDPLNV